MEEYWKMTKDYIDSKFNEFPWAQKKKNTGLGLSILLGVAGLGIVGYTLICFLTKKKGGKEISNVEHYSANEPAKPETLAGMGM